MPTNFDSFYIFGINPKKKRNYFQLNIIHLSQVLAALENNIPKVNISRHELPVKRENRWNIDCRRFMKDCYPEAINMLQFASCSMTSFFRLKNDFTKNKDNPMLT